MTKDHHDIRFDVPLYTLAEAARALDVPATTFATWARGYGRVTDNNRWHCDPIVTSLDGRPSQASVPFVGLAEGMVLAAVRKSGVPMQRVRPALAALAAEIGVAHTLASSGSTQIGQSFSTTLQRLPTSTTRVTQVWSASL